MGQCLSCNEGKLSLPPAVFRAVKGRSKAAGVNHIVGVYPHTLCRVLSSVTVYVTDPRDSFLTGLQLVLLNLFVWLHA